MNSNTTVVLALVCAVLAVGFFVVRQKQEDQPPESFTPPPNPAALLSQPLIEDDDRLGNIVRVEIKRQGKETLVFEKYESETAGVDSWHMTEPLEMKVRTYEAEGFGRKINSLEYQVSYTPGEPGAVTARDAGLEPPAGSITIADADGKAVTVEVGSRVSTDQRYVRLAGSERICLGKTDLFRSLKPSLVEYRDTAIWNFSPQDATRIEVTDRSADGEPVDYVLVRDGDEWTMTAPVSARTTDKVDEMVRTVSRLRAIKWEADAGGRLAAYGLKPAATTIKVTVEKKTPIEEDSDGDNETEGETEETAADDTLVEMKTETRTYVVQLSDRSPIGEDTKTYMRIGDETMVATIMKTTAEKLQPVMTQWRDRRLTTADVDTASRITIQVEGTKATFTKGGEGWSFESDGGKVEPSQITELLGAIKSLEAVAFVETDGGDMTKYGLSSPRATVSLTVPGLESPLRIAVGDPTDPQTKRLVYVRKNEATSIAKVRTGDVDSLLKKPVLYRDREILSLDGDSIQSIELKGRETAGSQPTTATFQRQDGQWRMTAPVEADADQTKLAQLVAVFSNFKARAVVDGAAQVSAYGLHTPDMEVAITVGGADGDSSASYGFVATRHDGSSYLKRNDRPTIYEIKRDDYDRLREEFRSRRLLDLVAEKVTAFTVTRDREEHGFIRRDGSWTYRAEPDLPLDQTKVDNLITRILELEAVRFVRHTTGDPVDFALETPARQVSVTLDDGTTRYLDISAMPDSATGSRAFYAANRSAPGVALIAESALKSVKVDLADLEAK